MSLERFEACLKVTLEFEGGYSDDPHDHGGATNLGIEYNEWNDWLAAHAQPAWTLAKFKTDLTPALVEPLYLHDYWEPISDGSLPHPVDMVAFDAAVNEGVGKAKEFLAKTEILADLLPLARAHQIQILRTAHYKAIVAHDPSQNVFLDDWLGRVNALTRKIDKGWI